MSGKQSKSHSNRCEKTNKNENDKNDTQCCHQRCKTCKCQNDEERSRGREQHLLMISEPQSDLYVGSLQKKQGTDCDTAFIGTLTGYHNLLPRYLQDALKRAACSYPDHPFSRLCEIEHVMQRVRSEFPKGFKNEDSAQR